MAALCADKARVRLIVVLLIGSAMFFGYFEMLAQPGVLRAAVREMESPSAPENPAQEVKDNNQDEIEMMEASAHRVIQKSGMTAHRSLLEDRIQLPQQSVNHTVTRPTITPSTARTTVRRIMTTQTPRRRTTTPHSRYSTSANRRFTSRMHTMSHSVTPTRPYITVAPKVLYQSDGLNPLPVPQIRMGAVNCHHLFQGEEEHLKSVQTAIRLSKANLLKSRFLSPKELYRNTEDCPGFIKSRDYVMDSITPEEAEFPIAYSILMYYDAGQAERLLRAIYRPQNYYCFHVDAKADLETELSISRLASCFPNVFVAENPASVSWAYYGVLEAEFICMKQLIKYKKWKYFINLTGHEFPLKSNYEIVRILKIYNGSNEISNNPTTGYESRWQYVHILNRGRTFVRKSPPPHNITIHKGDAHVTLSREFVDYILTDKVALDFAEWLKDAYCPEEFFFSSLQYNAHIRAPGTLTENRPYYQKIVSRHKVWVSEGRYSCKSGNYRHSICIYGIRDLPLLSRDRRAFFINKLMADFETITYDCLEELYFNRTRDEYLGKKGFDFNPYTRKYFINHHY